MSNPTAQEIKRKADRLFESDHRRNMESEWSTLAEFILPNQSGIFFDNKARGERRTTRLFDSTALQANHDLAAAIHSTLTNPATKWSKISFRDSALNQNKEAKAWLDDTNNRIHDALGESNFDTTISKNYQFFTSLGTMCLLHEEKEGDDDTFGGFQFSSWHLSQIAFAEDKNGMVDTIYRRFTMTGKQALEKWPDGFSDETKEKIENDPFIELDFTHCIFPRDEKDVSLNELGLSTDPKKRPFASLYIFDQEMNLVEEGGYYEFPIHVTRWGTLPGEVYGRGPGHLALPDVRSLNKVRELMLTALARGTLPPVLVSNRDRIGRLDLNPNAVTFVDDVNSIRELVPNTRIDVQQFGVQDLRDAIRGSFFIDKLMLPPRTETGEMTAFETQERLAQMQRVLGPTLSRLNSELLSPLVLRSYKIMLRSGALAPMPGVLRSAVSDPDIDIRFTNQLSRSQSIDDLNNLRSFIINLTELSQIKPEALDWINTDGLIQKIADLRGVPQTVLASSGEVQQVRQQRAEQIQQQQRIAALQATGEAAAKLPRE